MGELTLFFGGDICGSHGVDIAEQVIPELLKEEKLDFLHSLKDEEIFDVKPVTFALPKEARIFNSYVCEKCGELVAESFLRVEDGKKVCLDCFSEYTRFC